MCEDGLLAHGKDDDHPTRAEMYWLASKKLRHLRETYYHELLCADLFAEYIHRFSYWDDGWSDFERETFTIPKAQGVYDRRMVLNGKIFLIEVDRGTEEHFEEADRFKYAASGRRWLKSLNAKVDAYQRFSRENPGASYKVLFIVKHRDDRSRPGSTDRRCEAICDMLEERKTRHPLPGRQARRRHRQRLGRGLRRAR